MINLFSLWIGSVNQDGTATHECRTFDKIESRLNMCYLIKYSKVK